MTLSNDKGFPNADLVRLRHAQGATPPTPCLSQRAGDSAPGVSGRLRGEGCGNPAEQGPVGVRAAHQRARPAGVGHDRGADLEQGGADGLRRRLGQAGGGGPLHSRNIRPKAGDSESSASGWRPREKPFEVKMGFGWNLSRVLGLVPARTPRAFAAAPLPRFGSRRDRSALRESAPAGCPGDGGTPQGCRSESPDQWPLGLGPHQGSVAAGQRS